MRSVLALWLLLLAGPGFTPSHAAAAPAKRQPTRVRAARSASVARLDRCSEAGPLARDAETSRGAASAASLPPTPAVLLAPSSSVRLALPSTAVRAVSRASSLARGRAPPPAA